MTEEDFAALVESSAPECAGAVTAHSDGRPRVDIDPCLPALGRRPARGGGRA
jgi:hypothetical protein